MGEQIYEWNSWSVPSINACPLNFNFIWCCLLLQNLLHPLWHHLYVAIYIFFFVRVLSSICSCSQLGFFFSFIPFYFVIFYILTLFLYVFFDKFLIYTTFVTLYFIVKNNWFPPEVWICICMYNWVNFCIEFNFSSHMFMLFLPFQFPFFSCFLIWRFLWHVID